MFCMEKYVYEVYKERSFTKAAQNLYISQPSLSARIKRLKRLSGNHYLTEKYNTAPAYRGSEKYILRQRRRSPRSNSG